MNTDIRSLQLLERDLEAVAARERDRLASLERALGDGGPGGPRRLARRGRGGGGGRNWAGVAAAVAAVLVLAGGIGFLSQVSDDTRSAVGGGDDAGAGMATPAPAEAPAGEEAVSEVGPGDETTRAQLGTLSNPGTAPQYSSSRDDAEGSGVPKGVGAAPAEQGDLTKIVRDGRIGIVIADGSFSKGVS
ncbi:MAG TPA: hypothetical protein VIC52_06375, partial [Actinomycetota bacterium]